MDKEKFIKLAKLAENMSKVGYEVQYLGYEAHLNVEECELKYGYIDDDTLTVIKVEDVEEGCIYVSKPVMLSEYLAVDDEELPF